MKLFYVLSYQENDGNIQKLYSLGEKRNEIDFRLIIGDYISISILEEIGYK